ncbi:hypothetical protein LCGC14_2433420 [marine sediment metagenome]|uniref:Uncharacterized protein n=1 Tax=marine sediment metagenome TaxID=412755 RepID=A0A0F9BL91_9ZZZZ
MKVLNLPILEQIIREQVNADVTTDRDEATMAMAQQLKKSEPFTHMALASLAAMRTHPENPEAAMMSVITYAIYIGMAYAKAEREVAELEGIK